MNKIESLRSYDPKRYWNELYKLDPMNVDEHKMPLFVKNSMGHLVTGVDAFNVWMNSFRLLGLETTDFTDFDTKFYNSVNNVVDQCYAHSFVCKNEDLDFPVQLDEVEEVVKKLKNGKAMGLNNIMNEVFKFGGVDVTRYLWKLFDLVFQNEVFPNEWSR